MIKMLSFINGKENFTNRKLGAWSHFLGNEKLTKNWFGKKIDVFLRGWDITEELDPRYIKIAVGEHIYQFYYSFHFFILKVQEHTD